jgi:transcriptional regulator with XRE-family HTH domain
MMKKLIPTGDSLRSLRNLAGLTLAEVADIGGTSIAYLSKVERGEFVPTKRYVAQVTSAIAGVLADAEKVPA